METRWFIDEELSEENLKNWIKVLKLIKEDERTDTYLALPKPHCDVLGIKSREGKFEIKYRDSFETFNLEEIDVKGKYEFWSKCSNYKKFE